MFVSKKSLKPFMFTMLFLSVLVLMIISCASVARAPQVAPVMEKMAEEVAPAAAMPTGVALSSAGSSGYADATASGGEIKQMIIQNGDLSIVVEDPRQTMTTIVNMTKEMGGFVVTSDMSMTKLDNGEEVPQGSITIRVPAEKMNEVFEKIKTGQGVVEVQSEHISGQDVTKEYTDLSSRKRNLEDAETRLRDIMNAATRTEDVLAVHNQLTQVREQIEVIQGQMQYYEQAAAFSAISVTITSKAAIQPITVGSWQPVGEARDAVQALINTTKVLVSIAIWIILFILPVFLMIFIPLRLIWLGIKRLRGKGKKTAAQVVKKPQEAEEAKEKTKQS